MSQSAPGRDIESVLLGPVEDAAEPRIFRLVVDIAGRHPCGVIVKVRTGEFDEDRFALNSRAPRSFEPLDDIGRRVLERRGEIPTTLPAPFTCDGETRSDVTNYHAFPSFFISV